MIRHAVTFQWRSGVTREEIDRLTAAISDLRGAIPGLRSISAGPTIGLRPGGPDYLLLALFDDEAAWHGYQAHPRHKALLADIIDPMTSQRQSIQILASGAADE